MRLSYSALSTILIIKISRVIIFSATEVSYPFHKGLLCVYLCFHPDHFGRPSHIRLSLSFRASLLVVCFILKLFNRLHASLPHVSNLSLYRALEIGIPYLPNCFGIPWGQVMGVRVLGPMPMYRLNIFPD